MSAIRTALRHAAYRSGALGLARGKLRRALTVAQFHRVIDPGDAEFRHADPVYTVSAPLFDQLLEFFRDHYAVVSLRDVADASAGVRALPDHPLLITFDDGWADNLRYAAPLLRNRGLPSVIFAAGEPILSHDDVWWQEHVFAAARGGALDAWLALDAVRAKLGERASGRNEADALDVVVRLVELGAAERAPILALLPIDATHARMMLAPEDLTTLASYGIAVGLHGFTHAPLTAIADVTGDLERSRAVVAAVPGAATDVLACPHGRYDPKVIAAATKAGMRLIFTSDQHLNRTEAGMLRPARPLGRIGIVAKHIMDGAERLDASAAARWLWARPAL